MERLPVGILLTSASVVAAWRLRHAWLARHVVVSRRDRVLTTAAPAGAAVCALTAVLGLLVIVYALTGAGAAVVGVMIAVLALAVVAALAVYGVVAWRVFRRPTGRPANGIPTTSPAAPAPAASPVPSGPPAPTGPPPGWVPPTPQAAALLEARRSGDVDAICAALAMRPLFWQVGDAAVDAHLDGGPPPGAHGRRTDDGGLELVAFTEGSVPDPPSSCSYVEGEIAHYVTATGPMRVAVDEGHPHQVVVEMADVRSWTERHPDVVVESSGRLRAIAPVSTAGPFVHGLACAAWHAVLNGYAWNRFGPRGLNRQGARLLMRGGWGIESARDWQQMLDRLADPEPFGGDLVFGLRRQIGEGALVPAQAVVDLVEHNVEHNGRKVSDAVLAELRQVEAYEGYLREHDVLAEWEQVHSLLAWDIGRGAMLARYGFDAGYCDESTGRWQVERFGTLARRCYDSWPEFGAALVLGRALWSATQYDEYGDTMMIDLADTVRPFTILLSDPTSPWRTVPFHPGVDASTDRTPSDAGGR